MAEYINVKKRIGVSFIGCPARPFFAQVVTEDGRELFFKECLESKEAAKAANEEFIKQCNNH